jgi:hypothetical protein
MSSLYTLVNSAAPNPAKMRAVMGFMSASKGSNSASSERKRTSGIGKPGWEDKWVTAWPNYQSRRTSEDLFMVMEILAPWGLPRPGVPTHGGSRWATLYTRTLISHQAVPTADNGNRQKDSLAIMAATAFLMGLG